MLKWGLLDGEVSLSHFQKKSRAVAWFNELERKLQSATSPDITIEKKSLLENF